MNMKGAIPKLLLAALINVISLIAGDPRIGTWKLAAADMSVDPPRKTTLSAVPNGIHSNNTAGIEFTAKFDGGYYPLTGGMEGEEITIRK